MQVYSDLLRDVIANGESRADRTGVGTKSVFGRHIRMPLDPFPLLTGKKLHVKSIVHELLWFIRGSTNSKELEDVGVNIWKPWAYKDGDLGPVYGNQWRAWQGNYDTIDQLEYVIRVIKNDPTSRRLVVSAWNVGELDYMALPPCHVLFQLYVHNRRLSCQVYQRSADIFLGVPFNLASYALLTCMIAQVCDLKPGELCYTFGDLHLYDNHTEAATEYLSRELRPLPTLRLNPEVRSLFDFVYEDVTFEGYNPHAGIKAPVAV